MHKSGQPLGYAAVRRDNPRLSVPPKHISDPGEMRSMALALTNLCLRGKWRKRSMTAKRDRLSYGNVFSSSCPRCKGYLGVVLPEPGRSTRLRAINGHCVQCGHRLAWILIRGKASRAHRPLRKRYAGPRKTRERQTLLKRIREIHAERAQIERNIQEIEAQLPIDEQLCLNLRRFIYANIPELARRIEITWSTRDRQFSVSVISEALSRYTPASQDNSDCLP
jgi:hypothetical protein